jgi:hypothetical protein
LERPGAVKGAPLLGAAKRTLDGEDRSKTIGERERRGERLAKGGAAILAPSLDATNSQRLETAGAISFGPFQQGVHRDPAAFGLGHVVVPGRDLFGAPCEFAARQGLQNQRSDKSIAE